MYRNLKEQLENVIFNEKNICKTETKLKNNKTCNSFSLKKRFDKVKKELALNKKRKEKKIVFLTKTFASKN